MSDVGQLHEERLTPIWKVALLVSVLFVLLPAAWFANAIAASGHDKAANNNLQRLWYEASGVPLRTVIPPENRWMKNAFVADASAEKDKAVRVLILDAHYRSGDPSLASPTGIIGDKLNLKLLCSLPAQANARQVVLDEQVADYIARACEGS